MASIAQVRYPPPTETGWEQWAHQHAQHHEAIERSMAQILGVTPVIYPVYPFFQGDLQNWINAHQQAHNRFCQLLGIAGRDLSGLDLNDQHKRDDWVWLNFIEHQAAAQRLGTTIV